MKFNLIISNPPYNRNLDLKILKTVYELGEKICFIHPAGWAYSNKPNVSKLIKDVKKFNLASFERVKDASLLFDINIMSEICISMFNKKCKNPIDINEIDIHGNSKIYKSLKKKILKYKSNLEEFTVYGHKIKDPEIHIGIPGIFGRLDNKKYSYNIIRKTKINESLNNNDHIKFAFNSITKAINFRNYLMLKVVRFAFSLYRINIHTDNGELASVPYMPTYEHEWTDEMVAKELGLTDEELKWAINWIPDYYTEDAEKYKNYEV